MGVDPQKIEINFGLGRGHQYYTGIVFELHSTLDEMKKTGISKLCGGGRYHDLLKMLRINSKPQSGGSEASAACGFAYGLERLYAAQTLEKPLVAEDIEIQSTDVLVVPIEAYDLGRAISIAKLIRNSELTVEFELGNRNIKTILRSASKSGVKFVVLIGSQEAEFGEVIVREMSKRQQEKVKEAEVCVYIKTILAAREHINQPV
jgi:histidyl-tRNA synthetase